MTSSNTSLSRSYLAWNISIQMISSTEYAEILLSLEDYTHYKNRILRETMCLSHPQAFAKYLDSFYRRKTHHLQRLRSQAFSSVWHPKLSIYHPKGMIVPWTSGLSGAFSTRCSQVEGLGLDSPCLPSSRK